MKRKLSFVLIILVMLVLISCMCPVGGLGGQPEILKQLGGAAATAQMLATEMNSEGFASTAQAMLTDIPAEGIQSTLEAMMPTDLSNPENLQATLEAMLQPSNLTGNKPEDIPVWNGTTENLYADSSVVSYMTSEQFSGILDFYKNEMPANGWEASQQGTVETADAAVLIYLKTDRRATVTISRAGDKTSVQVTITTP